MRAPGPAQAEILLIEDDSDVREALAFRLGVEGFVVRLSDDAPATECRPPACVVADYRLPAGDGLAAIAEARARFGAVPAILVTSFPEPALRRAAARQNVEIVEKPLIDGLLVERLKALCAAP
jgi:CheY-like chemotaxis protein